LFEDVDDVEELEERFPSSSSRRLVSCFVVGSREKSVSMRGSAKCERWRIGVRIARMMRARSVRIRRVR
jgi:hypothetical protein